MGDCNGCYFYGKCDMDELCDDAVLLDDDLIAEMETEKNRYIFLEEWFDYIDEYQ